MNGRKQIAGGHGSSEQENAMRGTKRGNEGNPAGEGFREKRKGNSAEHRNKGRNIRGSREAAREEKFSEGDRAKEQVKNAKNLFPR